MTRAILLAAAILMSWWAPWTGRQAAEPPASPIVVARPAGPAEIGLVEWAVGRFDRAGLEVPPVTLAFAGSDGPCDGHPALFRGGPEPRIDLCRIGPPDGVVARKTVLHELAHAWAAANLDDGGRAAFLAFRRLEVWSGPEAPWELRGGEHAAEVLAWALMDRELAMATIPDSDPETLARGYLLLTGALPPAR